MRAAIGFNQYFRYFSTVLNSKLLKTDLISCPGLHKYFYVIKIESNSTASGSLPSAFTRLVERGNTPCNKLCPFLLGLSRSGLCESLEGTLGHPFLMAMQEPEQALKEVI